MGGGLLGLPVNGIQKELDDVSGNSLGEAFRFAERELDFIKGIVHQKIFVFKEMEKRLKAGNFAFGGLGLVSFMEHREITIEVFTRERFVEAGGKCNELREVNTVCFDSFGVQLFLDFAV